MTRKSIATVLTSGAVVFFLLTLVFADGISAGSPGLIRSLFRGIAVVCWDPATQLMLVLYLACCFVMLLILKLRAQSVAPCLCFINPDAWLAALVLLALLRYALAYDTAAHSIQMPILMAGMVFGKAVSTWTQWLAHLAARRTVGLILWLVCLLAGSALWRLETTKEFQYHGFHRWSGVWDNPNIYGLLMGAGLVLAVGGGLRRWRMEDGGWKKALLSMLYFTAAGLCGIGLFKSYSRGAWLAVFVGLIYLMVQTVKSSRFSTRFRRNQVPLALFVASSLFLIFWQFRYSEARPAHRVLSVANSNDFSWRNRITAWEGAVRMMVDRPFIGFGWAQAEEAYGAKYCPLGSNEAAAIEMNDYMMIGISAGVPAMICFFIYIGLVLKPKPEIGNLKPEMTEADWLRTTCRVGAIVFLVGFWFDGGLFKLPTAVLFWMLLELSRVESGVVLRSASIPSVSTAMPVESPTKISRGSFWWKFGRRGSAAPPERPLAHSEMILRWLAALLAAWAAAETGLHLLPPHFAVSERTLAIARKVLVQPEQKADFEALATQPIWNGQKLKTLLDHVELANYNRELINWQLDDTIYRDFVLSPIICPDPRPQTPDPNLSWRRPLWEEFYPRIRHESLPEDAAKIVVRHLRERVTIANLPNPPHEVPEIWLKQITDEAGFQIIYVAALRSVGVPARLDVQNQAEFYDGTKWLPAPSPSVISL